MLNKFTVHCINWNAGAELLNEVRVAAQPPELFGVIENVADNLDQSSRHALAITDSGKIIGCARITSDWLIDRIVVLQQEGRSQIEAALVEILCDYACQMGGEVKNSLGHLLNERAYPTLLAA